MGFSILAVFLPAAVVATATAAEAAAIFAGLHWTSFVNGNAAAADIAAVGSLFSCFTFFVVFKFDKAEAFAAASVAVSNDLGAGYSSVSCKHLLQLIVCGGKW